MRLPVALPDESLYSRMVRSLTVTGMERGEFLATLTGQARACIHPWLTASLIKIAEACGEPVQSLFGAQTLLPLFSFFLPHHRQQIYRDALFSRSACRSCQLMNFREYETLTLKYCPVCAREDINMYGVTYWHLNHQIPGVEACHLHEVWLYHTPLPPRPHIGREALPLINSQTWECTFQAHNFARNSAKNLDEIRQGHAIMPNYCNELNRANYITNSGRIRRKKMSVALFCLAQQVAEVNNGLLPESDSDYRYFTPLLKESVNQHPFKHLLMSFFLEQVDSQCEKKSSKLKHPRRILPDTRGQCKIFLAQGLSMAEISRCTGKSRCYIKSLAIRENIPLNFRPKKLTNEVQKGILHLARQGFHRNEIARRYGVSDGSVEALISSVHGLVDDRKKGRFESRRRRYKVQIIRWLRKHPQSIRQQCKKDCYSAFFWLYRHERAWLEAVLPAPLSPVQHRKVNGKSRENSG
ncbi:TnsD family Tn7-like transposition protein [Citrobacter werkmanii]|uniref:TnsD family Tn7-like transposition protein n=1 Tax=Citrobacter werkmanii TaxID=67827 RepID=UPI002656B191|nr:TnsD family Tn7-like transposition protein [Citrobacter werkmanii]MDN8558373.1 TnsD family Tn7-like transposition protein [Citrobacter werkmanii]